MELLQARSLKRLVIPKLRQVVKQHFQLLSFCEIVNFLFQLYQSYLTSEYYYITT